MMTQVTGNAEAGEYSINGQTKDADGNPLDPNRKNYINVDGKLVKPQWGAPPRPDVVREVPVESPMSAMAGADQVETLLMAMQTLEDMVEKQNRTVAKQNEMFQSLLTRMVGMEQRELQAQAALVAAPPAVPSAFPVDALPPYGVKTNYPLTPLSAHPLAQTVPASQVTPGQTIDAGPPEKPAASQVQPHKQPVLSNRAQMAIENNGCPGLGDVMEFDRETVSGWPGIGPAILAEIELKIKESGGFFRM